MLCCVDCFSDIELISIIQRNGRSGHCDFCNHDAVIVFDLEKDDALTELFEDLVDIFQPWQMLPADYPKNKLFTIEDFFTTKWKVINPSHPSTSKLLKAICKNKLSSNPELFSQKVGIEELNDKDYLDQFSILKKLDWDDFVDEIKWKNRFHANRINEEAFKSFLDPIVQTLNKGTKFYRARLSDTSKGFQNSEMGAPKKESTSAGRINPEGIRVLYLSDSIETAISEVRAGKYDFVTVGEFSLRTDIEIVNLHRIDKISPFSGIDPISYAVNIFNLERINKEIAKPLRKSDSKLDYLPTQFISELIKSFGYKGIAYESTMFNSGLNISIFDEKLLKCKRVEVFDIVNIVSTQVSIHKKYYQTKEKLPKNNINN